MEKSNPTVKMFAGPEPKNIVSHFSQLKPSLPIPTPSQLVVLLDIHSIVVYQNVRVVTGPKRLGVTLPH